MEKWIIYALISMVFAGLTSVIAKVGLKEISGDLGVAIRTGVVFLFVMLNAFIFSKMNELQLMTRRSLLFLVISGLTTSLSWIFYYKAIKMGPVSYVASIDKASIVITLVLSFVFLKEPFTPKIGIGAALILAGMFVLIYK